MKKTLLLSAMLLAQMTRAEISAEFPHVDDTSYTETNGNRVIRLSIDIPASTDEVWKTITTTEGWKSYAAPFVILDMQVDGIIESSYNPKAQAGDPNNIKNQIVAYVPGRMLAIRCVQAPGNFEYKKEFYSTATSFELERLDEKKTRVFVTAVGYRKGEAYDSLFKKFRWGDAYTLEKLRDHFVPEKRDAKASDAKISKENVVK